MARTVLQWVTALLAKIDAQTAYAVPYEQRYRNEYTLPFLIREYAEVYGADAVNGLMSIQPPRTGTAAVVVDAFVERLNVKGAQSDDSAAVKLVEDAWEDNDLDVMHREAHRESMIKRTAFAQVSRSADGRRAIVGIDAAEQVAVHRMPGPPYDVDAALKVWTDEWTGRRRARLWLPGVDYDLTETGILARDPEGGPLSTWMVVGDPRPTGLPGVPVVEFPAQARLLVDPVSEIEPIVTHVDIVDLIEGLMVFAGHFGAVPIRWATGLEVPRDPKDPTKPLLGPNGKPLIGFNPRADHTWVSTSADAKFGQLTPASLESFVSWAQHASMRIRAKTGVASTYLSLDLKSHMSAELLKTDEAPMVRRTNAKGRDGTYGQAWRRVMQLILQIEDPTSSARVVPRWEDPQTRIESQDADVFSKLAPHLGALHTAEKVLGWSRPEAEAAVAAASEARIAADPFAGLLGKPLIGDPAGDR